MKNRKFLLIAILLMVVGFAAVSTTLYINGTATVKANIDDFDIYFSEAILDDVDVSDKVILEDKKHIKFTTRDLTSLHDTSVLKYTVANNSKNYDAKVTVNCTPTSTKYLSIAQTPKEVVINAKDTSDGTVTVTLTAVSTEDITTDFECELQAESIERTSLATGDIIPAEQVTYSNPEYTECTDLDCSINELFDLLN